MKVDNNQKLYTDLYNKPTDTNSYLNYDSAHPPNCKKSLPYSQLLRIKRICTKESDYICNANKKLKEFEAKNYPEKILLDSIEKVNTLKRENVLKKKEKNNDDPATQETYLTCTFRPNYQKVPKLSKKNWDILARSSTTKDLQRNKLRILSVSVFFTKWKAPFCASEPFCQRLKTSPICQQNHFYFLGCGH